MIIVGGGVTGLITAVECVLAGHEVTVLDRGPIPHSGSSSYDQHRVIRALGHNDQRSTHWSNTLHDRWLSLERLLCAPQPHAKLYRRVGVVSAFPADEIESVAAHARNAGLSIRLVKPEEFPHVKFPAGSRGVLELDAGVLLADRVLWSAARWLASQPSVRLRPRRAVSAVDTSTGRVKMADGTIERGDLVLIACGPWSSALVDLPTVLYRQTMVYLRPPNALVDWWNNAPSVGRIGVDGRAWLMPPGDGTLLKISTHAACREVADVDEPESTGEPLWRERILQAGILTEIERYTVVAVKRCHYTVDARSGTGSLVRVGPSVWARAASGGNGFRTAPIMADQILNALGPPPSGAAPPAQNNRYKKGNRYEQHQDRSAGDRQRTQVVP